MPLPLLFPEKAMAPHPSTLAWKIPWTEEPGRLQSMGSRRVGQDWATSLSLFTFLHWRRKWQSTPVFLPGESQGWGRRVGHDWSGLAAAAAPLFNHLYSAITSLANHFISILITGLRPDSCLTGHLLHQLLGQLPLNTIPTCSLPFLYNSKSGFPYHHPWLNTSSELHPHPHISPAFPSFRYTSDILFFIQHRGHAHLITTLWTNHASSFYYPTAPSNSYSKIALLPVQEKMKLAFKSGLIQRSTGRWVDISDTVALYRERKIVFIRHLHFVLRQSVVCESLQPHGL